MAELACSLITSEEIMQDITLYMWATPNSRRASILLEELGLTYEVQPVNIRAGEQHDPKIVALNPFAKLPILTWHEEGERRVLFESGAILISIAERVGQLLPSEDIDHYRKMVVAINESFRIMDEIDEIIDEHGGWPEAFHGEASGHSSDLELSQRDMLRAAEDKAPYDDTSGEPGFITMHSYTKITHDERRRLLRSP